MVLALRNEDYRNWGKLGWPGTTTRGVKSNSTREQGEQKADMSGCIVQTLEQAALLNVFLLEVVKEFDHFSILPSAAASEQQADCRNIRICISREGFFGQQETRFAPRALLFLRGAGAAGGAIGAGGIGLGIGGDSEVARLRDRLNDDPFCFFWEIAVSEQSGLTRAVNGNPMHEALNETGVPALIQEKETDLGMVQQIRFRHTNLAGPLRRRIER